MKPEVTDEMVTEAMRAFERMSSVLRYREKDKWHSCDVMGMRDAIRAALNVAAGTERCSCLMCLAEGENSPHRLRAEPVQQITKQNFIRLGIAAFKEHELREIVATFCKLPGIAPQPLDAAATAVTEPRFFIDHGMIHDRATGKHVTTDGQPPFEDGIEQVLDLLNGLSGIAATPVVQDALEMVLEKLRTMHHAEHNKLGEMQADKSVDNVSRNWQGGRVNGLGDARMVLQQAIAALTVVSRPMRGDDHA